jgi:DNA-binding NtrC family response regulator
MTRPTRVLLVDDREMVRVTLRNILLGFECVFTEAENGARALELIPSNAFDVIVLDIKLPDLSGIEILREARKLDLALGKVIILTGFPDPETLAEAMELGVFRFLTKTPMNRIEIRQAFADAIAPPASDQPEEVHLPSAREATAPRSRRRAKGVPRPRILVVDSNELSLATMHDVLQHEFDVILTASADAATRRIARQTFALVVLDMNLAGNLSGLDVLSQMRRSVPELRAIMIAEQPDHETAFESGRRGALDYVTKGEWATLPATIRKALNERGRPIRAFLCYASDDRPSVNRLYDKLMTQGFLPWMDRKSIGAGKDWNLEIQKAIDETDYFVFCVSRHSVGREGRLRREVAQALVRQDEKLPGATFFIPARLESCPIDDSIRKFEYVDLFQKEGFAKLVRALST